MSHRLLQLIFFYQNMCVLVTSFSTLNISFRIVSKTNEDLLLQILYYASEIMLFKGLIRKLIEPEVIPRDSCTIQENLLDLYAAY